MEGADADSEKDRKTDETTCCLGINFGDARNLVNVPGFMQRSDKATEAVS